MSAPQEPSEEQKKKAAAAKKKTETDIAEARAAAARAKDDLVIQPPPIAPVAALDEEEPSVHEEFHFSPRTPVKEGDEDEDADEDKDLMDQPIWAVCRGDDCTAYNMTGHEAQSYCDRANQLLRSKDPKDRARAEESWILLKSGKRDDARIKIGLEPWKKSNPAETCKDYRSKMDDFKAGPRLKPLPGHTSVNPEDIEEEKRKRSLGKKTSS